MEMDDVGAFEGLFEASETGSVTEAPTGGVGCRGDEDGVVAAGAEALDFSPGGLANPADFWRGNAGEMNNLHTRGVLVCSISRSRKAWRETSSVRARSNRCAAIWD